MRYVLQVQKSVRTAPAVDPQQPSMRVLELASMFGLGVDESHELAIVPRCELPLPLPGVVFITGPSGSGKSTLLMLLAQALTQQGLNIINLASLPPARDAPLVDAIGTTLEQATHFLSLAGLNEAFIMLRRPHELSDGQRYRFTIARAMEQAEVAAATTATPTVILADEFGAALDRLTAHTIARNVRRWVSRPRPHPLTFVAATTHDDLLESLCPDVLICKGLGEAIEIMTMTDAAAQPNAEADANPVQL